MNGKKLASTETEKHQAQLERQTMAYTQETEKITGRLRNAGQNLPSTVGREQIRDQTSADKTMEETDEPAGKPPI
jgi:hypothetical protein